MAEFIENKNVGLAKKILEICENRPKYTAIFMDTDPESVSIMADYLERIMPGFTREDIARGFLALDMEGALGYENWKETYKENYDDIVFFDIIPNQEKLKKFVKMAEENKFGFQFSDEEYRKSLIGVLEMLANSSNTAFDVTEFHQKEVYKILVKIANYSNAIAIQEKIDVDFERGDDGEIYAAGGGYIPDLIVVKDKERLKAILKQVKITVEEIYQKGINSFFQNNKALEWRCKECGRWLGSFDSPIKIMEWLDKFSEGKYLACHKCRCKNAFSLSADGNITFSALENLTNKIGS